MSYFTHLLNCNYQISHYHEGVGKYLAHVHKNPLFNIPNTIIQILEL